MARLVAAMRHRLEDIDDAAHLASALRGVGDALATRPRQHVVQVPGLRHLPAALAGADMSDELALALRDAVGLVDWSSYYASTDTWAASFVEGFASGDLIGPNGPWVYDDVTVGAALYAPGLVYPPHGHAAPEAYLIVGGHAWCAVDGVTRTVGPGSVVVHPADAPHSYEVAAAAPLWLAWVRAGDVTAPVWAQLSDGNAHHPLPAD